MQLSKSHVLMLCNEFYRKCIETPDIKGTVILASFFEYVRMQVPFLSLFVALCACPRSPLLTSGCARHPPPQGTICSQEQGDRGHEALLYAICQPDPEGVSFHSNPLFRYHIPVLVAVTDDGSFPVSPARSYDRKRTDVLRCLAALMSNNVLSKTKTIMEVFTDEAE